MDSIVAFTRKSSYHTFIFGALSVALLRQVGSFKTNQAFISRFYLTSRYLRLSPTMSVKRVAHTSTSDLIDADPIYDVNKSEMGDTMKITRSVRPYIQNFQTYAKGRWVGREVQDVLLKEFGGHTPDYWINALINGHIRVNSQKVPLDYRFRNSDRLLHRTHRHEPPVFGEIELIGETEDILAVSKPPSMPMHACGAYRYNSLENILKFQPIIESQPNLYLVHRLDRLKNSFI